MYMSVNILQQMELNWSTHFHKIGITKTMCTMSTTGPEKQTFQNCIMVCGMLLAEHFVEAAT